MSAMLVLGAMMVGKFVSFWGPPSWQVISSGVQLENWKNAPLFKGPVYTTF